MRGSPILRTLIVLITLSLAGFGLSVLGGKRPSPVEIVTPEVRAAPVSIDCPFVLTLSSATESVAIESLGQTYSFGTGSQTVSGNLPIEKGHPTLFIDIEWADKTVAPRFAKLVLEPAGFPTQIKIFDTTGDLSDVWELHLHE